MSNVGIKRPCECTIAHDISLENVSRMHELSEAFHAISLRHTCLLSILEQFSKLSSRAGMDTLKRHLPISGPEGLNELRKIVERFEEKIYSTATSQGMEAVSGCFFPPFLWVGGIGLWKGVSN
ncbi:ARM REPEAT PROTEIN INTERACTING WITH ABF2 isoform X3 [Vitis vinifera]|uniref:ARM REPEAT PROTEIN INTERACTING WITH ABF2 isoform X3 n=1 Tax=Vitis vinifera TaxID=29760 RepID=UPI0028832DCF|nr:ARM REPEAT PROTEIN INTERACTING WITH ABF2 isoform X3 [Vitis vinifera]